MSEWENIEIKDIISSANTGLDAIKRAPIVDSDTGIKCLRIQDVSQNKSFGNWGFCEVEEKNYYKFKLKKDDIIIARTGASIGVNKYIKNDLSSVFNNGLIRLRTNIYKCLPLYLYYNLRTPNYNGFIENISGGTSTQPNMQINALLSFEINLPPLPEQKALVAVLSSLDDKIDLLHRQNKTLEALAETLFRQWFIEEADENWEIKPLGELVTVKRGGSPRPIQDYLSDSGLRWLKISDATKESSPFIFEIKEHIKEEGLNKTTLLKKDTLVLSNSATPGIPKILQIDTCIHDGWLHFPKSYFSNEFLYLLFKKIRPELLIQGNGSIFTNLKTDILKEYQIPIADKKSLKLFDEKVKPVFNKLLSNSIQIRTLEKIRDTLLPKLMRGEVKVKMSEPQMDADELITQIEK